jgi:hypothetical protein
MAMAMASASAPPASSALTIAVPDASALLGFVDLFERADCPPVVFTQTALSALRERTPRAYLRCRRAASAAPAPGNGADAPSSSSISSPRRCVVFSNEHSLFGWSPRHEHESPDEYSRRLVCDAAGYYQSVLGQAARVVAVVHPASDTNGSSACAVLSVREFVTECMPAAIEQFHSLQSALERRAADLVARQALRESATGLLSPDALLDRIRSGLLLRAVFHMGVANARVKIAVPASRGAVTIREIASDSAGAQVDAGGTDEETADQPELLQNALLAELFSTRHSSASSATSVFADVEDPEGTARAVHGDVVAVELVGVVASEATVRARVVGIVERRWRDYVCTMQLSEDEQNGQPLREERERIVVPLDRRIPRIRVPIRSAEELRDSRFVVRVDGWTIGDRYPHGHFMVNLGRMGERNTEAAALLFEHGLSVDRWTPQALLVSDV